MSQVLEVFPAAAYTCDPDGLITDFNRAALQLWGREPKLNDPADRFCGSFHLFSPDGAPLPHDRCWMALALRDRRAYTGLEIVIERQDGSRVTALAHASALLDDRGELLGAMNVLVDITERKRTELAAARLAAIVESSEDAIVSKDINGIIETWNRAAQRLFGYTAQQSLGRHISILIPSNRIEEEEDILRRLRAGELVSHFDTVRLRSDGQEVPVSLTISPVRDAGGHVIGASKIARDITERRLAEERIYALMTRLKESDRRKDEFLAVLAHELRNPLAAIGGVLNLFKRTPAESQGHLGEVLERQLAQMVRLVDELMDISRIGRGKVELHKEVVEIESIFRHALDGCRERVVAGNYEMSVSWPSEPISLYADAGRLQQVFVNLLDNAFKYTQPGGRICVTVERQNGTVEVTVRDNGIGIPPDKLASVFEMFMQVEPSLEQAQGGLGIGLTLAKRLVAMHGGAIQAHSDGPGLGSKFVVRLPIVDADLVGVDSPGAEAGPSSSRRILVVDDNRDSATTLRELLVISGNETRVAFDGLEALELAATFRPELILLDISLPKLNGYEVCRSIREQPWAKRIVIVALTGWGQEEDRRLSIEAGFDHHIVKPLDHARLESLLAGASDR